MNENPLDRSMMYSAPPAMQINPARSYVASISTAKGDIVVQLDAGVAPQTVNNFVFLSREGFYDGLVFHRVEPGFVIQGGDPNGDGSGGPGYTLPAEIECGLPHIQGAVAAARLGDAVNPDKRSSGSQFYIVENALGASYLDMEYTVFGQVMEGISIVEAIAEVEKAPVAMLEASSTQEEGLGDEESGDKRQDRRGSYPKSLRETRRKSRRGRSQRRKRR